MTPGLLEHVAVYGRMIKFSHTVFALPFALAAVVIAQRRAPLGIGQLLWILVAMAGARSAAMGFNRIVDARIDARNPRTAAREIPSGRISVAAAGLFVVVSAAVFVAAAGMLGRLCLLLSLPVLVLLLAYSYTKRFTPLAHLYLGFAISLAPAGAWIAVTGGFDPRVALLCLALMTYIAGFDILYACQDAEFDRREGLQSIPARLGVAGALAAARGLHAAALLFLVLLGPAFGLKGAYLAAVGLIAALMAIEHRMVRTDDLSRVPVAFFHVNSLISITLFLGVLADEIFRRWT